MTQSGVNRPEAEHQAMVLMCEVARGANNVLVDEECGSGRHSFIFRRDFLLLATVTSIPLAGINEPLLQVRNSSNMRIAMEKRASPYPSCRATTGKYDVCGTARRVCESDVVR